MTVRRKSLFILMAILLAVALAVSAVAWFTASGRDALTDPVLLDRPPILNVLNNETTHTDILNLDGLVTAETYDIVFCVTPNVPGAVQLFDMEVAFTTNLGATVSLYPAEYVGTEDGGEAGLISKQSKVNPSVFYYYRKASQSLIPVTVSTGKGYTDEEKNSGNVQELNLGCYQYYSDSTWLNFAPYEGSWTDNWGNNPSRYLFYVLEISWPSDFSGDVDSRETDLLYVSVNGRSSTATE